MVSTGKGACTCSYYFPDGKHILFGSSHLDPTIVERARPKASPPRGRYSRTGANYKWEFDTGMDIFKADPDGSNLVRLTDSPGYDAEGAATRPTASRSSSPRSATGDAEIWIMDADGKNPGGSPIPRGYDGGPFFSPDGRRIIYRSDRKNNDLLQIYVNNPEGTAERQLTDNNDVNWGPFWHPDARHIIYATSRHGHQNYELYLMDVDTGSKTSGSPSIPGSTASPSSAPTARS